MVNEKLKKALAVAMAATLVATSFPAASYTKVLEAHAKTTKTSVTSTSVGDTDVSKDDDGVYKVTMDDTGYITADGAEYDPDGDFKGNENTPFSWDNASVYFVITDRFKNGDKSNDHSYGRSGTSDTVPASYKSTFQSVAGSYAATGEKDNASYESRVGTFHGGDLKGLTEYIDNGYFDALGTNAIWITAPYEQVHGGVFAGGFKHYAYHGYYALDYTEVDANMGTEEDLHKFIDTAHEHGIRVIFDVVMNHSGYPDSYTIAEYYGADSKLLTSKWQKSYFDVNESQYQWWMDYDKESQDKSNFGAINYTSEWNNSWYTTAWERMVAGRYSDGYTGTESGDEVTYCSAGLPDFKTEDSSGKPLPDILNKKWAKEDQLAKKKEETNKMLKACGYGEIGSASVKQYLVAWLANWVREYGVDGFRCDTAKHVTIDCWEDLNTQCNKALKVWRSNNSDKACSKWTDNFWMTGEVYDQGLSMTYQGTDFSKAFDSLINFKFQGVAGQKGSALDSTYSSYASYCNKGTKENALSYVSSHDKGIGARGASVGTALLLCPGGVQTYYGDETSRQAGGGSGDQPSRSQMTWNDTACLANWQKVGRFRRNHIAVGAGKHKKLADSPYTFSRTYKGKATVGAEAKSDYEDKVVVSLPTTSGTFDVPVGDVFADKTTVVDEYSGEQYTVKDGKVTGVTCDNNGVILLAEPTEDPTPKAKVTASVGDKSAYTEDKFTTTIKTENVTDATYQINDCTPVSFKDSADITIGEDTAYEETTTVKVTGKSSVDSSEVSKTFTYKRSKEPTVGQASEGLYVRVKKSDFDKEPQIYVYGTDTNGKAKEYTSAWPGTTMELDSTGEYYVYNNAEITSKVNVIVHSYIASATDKPSWRSTPDMKDPDPVEGSVELEKGATDGTFKKITLATGEKATVTVKYVDSQDKELKTITRVGAVDADYTVYAPKTLSTVSGYELAEGQDTSKTGKFTAEEQTVTFTYNKVGEVVTPTPVEKTPDPTEVPTATPTEVPATATPTVVPTTEAPATEVPATEVPVTATPTVVPTTEAPATATPTAIPTETPKAFETKVSTNPVTKQIAGYYVNITGQAANGSGNYQYRFLVEDEYGNFVYVRAYNTSAVCTWKTRNSGKYVITVYAKDMQSGKITTASKSLTVTPALSVKKLNVKRLKKLQYQLESLAAGGAESYKYQFSYVYKGKTKIIKKYSSKRICKNAFRKAGKYKIIVSIKDKKGKVVKKTKTVRVK